MVDAGPGRLNRLGIAEERKIARGPAPDDDEVRVLRIPPIGPGREVETRFQRPDAADPGRRLFRIGRVEYGHVRSRAPKLTPARRTASLPAQQNVRSIMSSAQAAKEATPVDTSTRATWETQQQLP